MERYCFKEGTGRDLLYKYEKQIQQTFAFPKEAVRKYRASDAPLPHATYKPGLRRNSQESTSDGRHPFRKLPRGTFEPSDQDPNPSDPMIRHKQPGLI